MPSFRAPGEIISRQIMISATFRSKNRNTILFSRSQAERERIITEKVAIILIDSDGQNSDSIPPASCYFEPKSKFLRNIRDKVLIFCSTWGLFYPYFSLFSF